MMKQLTFFFLCIPVLMFGQTSGEITFEETIKLEIDLPEGMEAFKDKIPSSQNFNHVLLFNQDATIFKNAMVEDTDEETINMSGEDSQVQMRMEFDMPENKLYQEVASGKTVEKREFMGKKFLIEGEAKRYKWNLTGKQKTVLNYTCQQAIYKDTSRTVVAWFSSEIPVSSGPANYAGLPGMILELDINDGERHLIATNVALKELEKNLIKAPKKGKKVSNEEFDKIVEEKTKEMQEEFGGSGNVIIKVRG